MADLINIIEKPLSGEWGSDDLEGDGIPVLRTTNFTNSGEVSYINVVTRTIAKKNIANKYLRKGDIIIEKSGGSDDKPVGRVVFFEGPENTYLFNNFTGLLRISDTSKWHPKFVFYFLFANYIKGGTRPYENKTTGLHNLKLDRYLASLRVHDLDLQTQMQCSNTLDKITAIIQNHKTLLSKLDNLVKARFVEMFGDFVENPRNWRVEELGDYIVFMTSGPRGWSKYFSDAGEYFLTIRNVKGCNVFTENIQHVRCPNNAEADRTKVKEGDLLISITADLGRTGVVSEQIANHGTYINQHLMCVRLMKEMLHPVYVAHLLESEGGRLQFSQKNQSAVKAGLNYESIRTLKIMVPPMHLQLAFVAFITQVDKSKVAVQKALDKAQQLYDSLMQEYFD